MAVAQITDLVKNIMSLIPDPPAPQHAGFLAYLCDATDPEKFLLILCCSPCHLTSEVKKDIPSEYRVIFHGESTSNSPLNKDDQASFHLPDTFTLINKADTCLTYVLMQLQNLIHNYFKLHIKLLYQVPSAKRREVSAVIDIYF